LLCPIRQIEGPPRPEKSHHGGGHVDPCHRLLSVSSEGSTPALGDAQASRLFDVPPEDTLKGVRDRAIWPPCFITASVARNSAG
jgi:hypothetical protein